MGTPTPLTPDWVSFLSSAEIFREIPEPALRELAARLELIDLQAGETLIRQGDAGDCMYLIVSGRVQVVNIDPAHEEKVLAELGPGQSIGELALWTGDLRSSTVRTTSIARVAKLTREDLNYFAKNHPEAVEAIDRFVGIRLRKNRLSVALHVSKLFGDLGAATLRDLEAELELVWIEGGTTLFRQGEAGDALYLVVSGSLQVLLETAGEEPRAVGQFGHGETIGEMALLEGEPRNATVLALRDSQVARLPREGFERLISRHQALLVVIARKLVARLREQSAGSPRRPPSTTVIAVAPATIGFPLDEFCAQLAEALSTHGRTLSLGSAGLDAYVGKPGAAQTSERAAGHGRIMELLGKMEAEHRYVIYQADASDSLWTRRCLRQCDHVVIAADAAEDPRADAPVHLERALSERTGRSASLVLLHRDATRLPTGTKAWLSGRTVDQHYHVRPDSRADFDRVARCLTGRAVGLVLGGGGARGLGHLGVVRALREAGIPIDIVGGTSMGSIMAAGCALEYDYQRMLKSNLDGWAALVKDKTLPIISFFTGYAISKVLYDELGETQIEDLWIPFFCVSANLTRARVDIHRRGPLVKAMLASARVPGLYPPIISNGDLLVDGGIINNVPVDIMRGSPGCGTVIASDVSPAYDPTEISDYGIGISGWKVLMERLKPSSKRQRLPGFFSVLMRTMEFGGASYKSQNIGAADLYLTPPMETFGMGEYKRATEMAEVGYRYSSEKIADWLASSPAPRSVSEDRVPAAARQPGRVSTFQFARVESKEASA